VAASATLAAKIPVVATFHAAGYASCYYERWRPLATRIHACITCKIAVSEAARECVSRNFPGDYRVIPSPIVVETYAKARDGEKVSGRILFLGRPEPRKGLMYLVQAFNELRKRLPQVSLTLVGTSQEELRSLFSRSDAAESLDLRGIEALGRVSLEAKIEQMRRAEVLCAPSLGGESFGLVLTEAMAAGLPVIASDIPGYRAVMADGAAGMLVQPGDSCALEKALFSTLTDVQLRQELTAGGIERAQHFSWEKAISKIVGVYEEALAKGPMHTEGAKLPVIKQARHFMKSSGTAGKKSPREARSHALS
jgi:phosphatidylinositol alpha-mannosyltransferase